MEKLKFVLEFKIEDLRAELAPKDQEVEDLTGNVKVRARIGDMH